MASEEYTTASLKKGLVEAVDKAVDHIKNPSGMRRYPSSAAFIVEAIEEKLEREAKP